MAHPKLNEFGLVLRTESAMASWWTVGHRLWAAVADPGACGHTAVARVDWGGVADRQCWASQFVVFDWATIILQSTIEARHPARNR